MGWKRNKTIQITPICGDNFVDFHRYALKWWSMGKARSNTSTYCILRTEYNNVMWTNPQKTANLLPCTKETLNEILLFRAVYVVVASTSL